MTTARQILVGAGAVLLLSAVLTACAEPRETSETPTPDPVASVPADVPAEPTQGPAADPTCESIVPESVVASFTEAGWTYREHPFRIGEAEFPSGIHCVWGDYSVPSDHIQVFGWAPMDATQSTAAQQALLADGWLRTDDDTAVYITENPEHAMSVDEAGYGMTYLFGPGWVKLADTKQSLILIEGAAG